MIDIKHYISEITKGNIIYLSKALTLIESKKPADKKISNNLLNSCYNLSGNSIRIGISVAPGVGKSSLIDEIGCYLTSINKKVAVLTIDPSSSESKGSILGDKTRMEKLSKEKYAFIRPSPNSGFLGGVNEKTSESIILCEAAGFDVILIETVGVGQSEIEVDSMVDFFLLLTISNTGDELQGIKKGIIEKSHSIVITKHDGNNIQNNLITQNILKNVINLRNIKNENWTQKIILCSSHKKKGIIEIWKTISNYIDISKKNGSFLSKREKQSIFWMNTRINNNIKNIFFSNPKINEEILKLKKLVLDKKINPYEASELLFENFFILKKEIKDSY